MAKKRTKMYSTIETELEEDSNAERPSKSQLKRDSQEIHRFLDVLCKLSAGELKQLTLPEDISIELNTALKMPSPVARARQLKFVGKIIRNSGVYLELKDQIPKNRKRRYTDHINRGQSSGGFSQGHGDLPSESHDS